ncbi:MAG: SDR family oxidoreductase [Coriobacteriia bacterium]|nr:SDR family oxidoreductase [Coriobacteriia bacterium]
MGLLDGKVALVTGASSGIGRESALAFARAGAKVVVADVDVAGGEETVGMIKKAGGEAVFVKTDVTKKDEVKVLVDKAVETYGRLDCAHNNAGIEGIGGPCTECTEENWDLTIAINLTGVFNCCKAELPQMLKQGGGAIVNTASVAGLVGFPGLPAYVASKFGVNGLTKSIALDYATENIRCNSVCPGVIHTPMIDRLTGSDPEALKAMEAMEPVGRLGKPSEIADAVVWLCTDEASFVTGVNLPVDGALTAQ